MTRRLVAVALAPLALLLLSWWSGLIPHVQLSPMPAQVLAQLPGRGETPVPTPVLIGVDLVGRYSDGSSKTLYSLDTVPSATIPAPTATATNTHTPTVTATSTPAPTLTPKPTITLLPTVTPPPTATAPPTFTPAPASPTPTKETYETPVPTPGPTECVLRVTVDKDTYLNIRDAPAMTGKPIGKAYRDDWLKPEGKYTDAYGNVWYLIYGTPEQSGFVISTWVEPVPGYDCSSFVSAAWLIHVVPGYNAQELAASYPILAQAGISFGVKSYADMTACLQALYLGGECIYRWPVAGDCPAQIGEAEPVASARHWMARYEPVITPLKEYAQTGRVWIEVCNECYYGSGADIGVYYWWNTWMDAALQYAGDHDFPALVLPTFGPGYGDDALQYSIWKPALLRLAEMGGLLGYHAYTPYLSTGLCGCDPWLACRHRKNYATLQGQGITIGYAITEAARGWGNEPVDEADFVCFYDQVRYDPGLQSVAAWEGGHHQTWPLANLDGHYVSLARKIAQ